MIQELEQKINSKTAQVAIVGLGYVGLPLAMAAARSGFNILGVENNPDRCSKVNAGRNYIRDVQDGELSEFVKLGRIRASTGFEYFEQADVIIICVPTPLNKNKEPDISHIERVTDEIAKALRPGQLIILESTTYPGTTEEVIYPKLLARGFEPGKNVFLAFSPERVDPGNKNYGTANTPKIVGGMTDACRRLTSHFYSQFIQSVKEVSSPRVAEMTKIFENIYRSVNIALVNELAGICERMNVDVYEVISTADTKPYGFQAFWPGPGVGGHCIPLDPYYLSWKVKEYDFHARFIHLAGQINEEMPRQVVSKVSQILNLKGKAIRGSRILQLGVAYKKDIDDARESPAVHIYDFLMAAGAQVTVCDPHISEFFIRSHDSVYGNSGPGVKTVELTLDLAQQADLVLLTTDHTQFPYAEILSQSQVVFDTRNAFGFRKLKSPKLYHLSTRV